MLFELEKAFLNSKETSHTIAQLLNFKNRKKSQKALYISISFVFKKYNVVDDDEHIIHFRAQLFFGSTMHEQCIVKF